MEVKAAVVYRAGAEQKIESVDMVDVGEYEVIVKIVGVGICHTDIAAQQQYIPYPLPGVLGHEGAGIVEQVGSKVTKVVPGDPVALSWLCCGTCDYCKGGNDPFCENFLALNFGGKSRTGRVTFKKDGKDIHGTFFGQSSFATFALAEEGNVVKLPAEMPVEIAGPLGCGVQTGAGAVMNSLRPEIGSSIAVFGVGTVGMSAVMAAHAIGCTKIIAVDVHPDRLKLAEELGATHVVNANETDPVKAVFDITGKGAEYSLECVGNPKVFRQATDVLRLMGTCGLVGVVAPGTEVTLNMDLIMNGRRLKGVIEGDAIPDLFIPRLIDLHLQGRFPYEKLIKFYDFKDINKAIEEMEKGGVVKPVLRA